MSDPDLRASLDELQQLQPSLSERLAEAASGLRASGRTPPQALIGDLYRYRNGFTAVRMQLIDGGLSATRLDSLADLKLGVEAMAMREQASTIIDGVLALRWAGDDPFPPLERCHDICRHLQSELLAPVPEALSRATEAVAEQSPLRALSTLVYGGDGLDDDAWSQLHDRISAAFGRELATAVARRKIVPA